MDGKGIGGMLPFSSACDRGYRQHERTPQRNDDPNMSGLGKGKGGGKGKGSGKGRGHFGGKGKGKGKGKGFVSGIIDRNDMAWVADTEQVKSMLLNPWFEFGIGSKYVVDLVRQPEPAVQVQTAPAVSDAPLVVPQAPHAASAPVAAAMCRPGAAPAAVVPQAAAQEEGGDDGEDDDDDGGYGVSAGSAAAEAGALPSAAAQPVVPSSEAAPAVPAQGLGTSFGQSMSALLPPAGGAVCMGRVFPLPKC